MTAKLSVERVLSDGVAVLKSYGTLFGLVTKRANFQSLTVEIKWPLIIWVIFFRRIKSNSIFVSLKRIKHTIALR